MRGELFVCGFACVLISDLWCLLLFVWFVLCLVCIVDFLGYGLFGVDVVLGGVWCRLGGLLVCFWVLLGCLGWLVGLFVLVVFLLFCWLLVVVNWFGGLWV